MNVEKKVISITTPHITLGQMLKFQHVISSGAQAKTFIKTNEVKVNGVLCKARGKKLFNNDTVSINNTHFYINNQNTNGQQYQQ
jgi:ribosome-associated protein YbcJ (S4-like RNA binding protein)